MVEWIEVYFLEKKVKVDEWFLVWNGKFQVVMIGERSCLKGELKCIVVEGLQQVYTSKKCKSETDWRGFAIAGRLK